MSATLAIRLPARATDVVESVLVVDGTPQAAIETGSLENVARRADGNRVFVLVPGADVLLTRANVPMRGNARILQAVPYALEEQLATDVHDLHFAIGKRDADGQVPVAAVSRHRMEAWLARLAAAGLHPQALLSEAAAVPGAADGAVVLLEGDRAILRSTDRSVIETATDALEQVLDIAGIVVAGATESALGANSTLTVYASDDDQTRHADLIERLRARAGTLDIRSTHGHALRVLAKEAVKPEGINLLQGAYAPRTAFDTLWKPWRTAAMMLAAFVVVTLGLQAVRLLQLQAREAQLDAAIFDTLSRACDVRTLADARVQMQRCLDQRLGHASSGDDVFLDMLGVLSAALTQAPGTQVQSLSYRNRTLAMKLTVADIDTLDRIKTFVGDKGTYQLDIEQTRPTEGKVESQISMKKRST